MTPTEHLIDRYRQKAIECDGNADAWDATLIDARKKIWGAFIAANPDLKDHVEELARKNNVVL